MFNKDLPLSQQKNYIYDKMSVILLLAYNLKPYGQLEYKIYKP